MIEDRELEECDAESGLFGGITNNRKTGPDVGKRNETEPLKLTSIRVSGR